MGSRYLLRYLCSEGHEITSPHPIDACPGFHRGSPCRGELRQYAGPKQKAVA